MGVVEERSPDLIRGRSSEMARCSIIGSWSSNEEVREVMFSLCEIGQLAKQKHYNHLKQV